MLVCLFDIDGTLLRSGGAGKAALEEALADEFGVRGACDSLDFGGRTDRAILGEVLRRARLEDTAERRDRLLAAYLRHLPACLKRLRGSVLPGVVELLERLGLREDVAVGLLTGNARAGAHLKLAHYGLHQHFLFGGYGDRHADRADVAREAMLDAQRHLGRSVDPTRVWVIGDTPHDVSCARAIGANVVAVLTGWHRRDDLTPHAPDLILDDLSDPAEWLGRW